MVSQLTTEDSSSQKSCAEVLVGDGSVSIFDTNAALLYTPFFSGSKDGGLFKGSEEHFIQIGKGSKQPIKAMFTQIKMLSENLYECENMK